MCGVTRQFGRSRSGWSRGSGSGVVTSRAAKPISLFCPAHGEFPKTETIFFKNKKVFTLRACSRSSWFTIAPLATFTSTAVFFILLNASAPKIPLVDSLSAQLMTITSDSERRVQKSEKVAPSEEERLGLLRLEIQNSLISQILLSKIYFPNITV